MHFEVVREQARGHWPYIFAHLGIEVGTGRHRPCPACGGNDRFRCDDKDGRGSWFCNQCDPHAGDGFALVMNVRGCHFPEALRLVAGILGLTPSSHAPRLHRQHLIRKPASVDPRTIAFQFELGALDHRLRAERVMQAVHGISINELPDNDLDRLVDAAAHAYVDSERATLLEDLADRLRSKAFARQEGTVSHAA
jgi:hypothetical protein